MPNVESAKKRMRSSRKRMLRNRADRSALRTALKKANTAVAAGNAETLVATLPVAIKLIGRSASKGLVHRNKAARLQSRLVRKANALRKAS